MSKLKHKWSLGHNYLTGITFGMWCKVLAANGFRISPAYLHRAAAVTAASIGNSAFAGIERLRFGKQIDSAGDVAPPLFILGHWRSGTTLLHDLMAQDTAQFNYPNTYQVVNPLTFLTTENALSRLMAGLLPATRPMDNMAMSFASPQEDEFAPLLMTGASLYLGTSFPDRMGHYEKHLSFADADPDVRTAWKDAFVTFVKKLSLNCSRPLVMKSPPHTARIKLLLEMFPDARFVHIHRDPYRVFQSQRHFFDTAGWYTYMQRPDLDAIDEGILRRYTAMYDAYFADRDLIPRGHFDEVRYDDLTADPVGQVGGIYDALGLQNFDSFRPQLQAYVDTLEGYQKNRFDTLSPDDRALVARRWHRSFETWGYPK
ncbi:sulfotransferase family protein [Yoonia sp. 208BN28-4]|uniref:sulfotransferase family protein n=1 Tax=Yoonia sp. 208BN28-4 TaxID=3126505 RepID=UPI003099551A